MASDMTNKEKLLQLVSKDKTYTIERNRWKIRHRKAIRVAQQEELERLMKLDKLNLH